MRIILTRHGETKDNVLGKIQGQLPGKLTDNGLAQAQLLGKRLAEETLHAIYSSDLKRALDTAQEIHKNHTCPLIPTTLLRERDFSIHAGKQKDALDWDNLPKEVESFSSLQERAHRLLISLQAKHNGHTIALVGHAGINNAILTIAKPDSPFHKQKNTAVNIIDINDGILNVSLLNCTAHLPI